MRERDFACGCRGINSLGSIELGPREGDFNPDPPLSRHTRAHVRICLGVEGRGHDDGNMWLARSF